MNRRVALGIVSLSITATATALAVPPAPNVRASVPQRRSIYEVTDHIDPSRDCTVRRVGGQPVELCDLAPAFMRVFAICGPEADVGPHRGGCVINVAPGTFYLQGPIELCRPHVIRGAGGGAFSPATRIYAADGATAVRALSVYECRARKLPGAAGAELSHLAIEAVARTSTIAFFGIEASTSIAVEHVRVSGFVQGIRINAGARREGRRSNANGWWLADVWADHNAHAGIHIDGPDTNGGLALRPVATTNCQDAAKFADKLGPCSNIYSGEFLGSTFVAGLTESAKDLRSGQPHPGYVMGDNPSSRSVCVGCYAEGDQPRSPLGRNANAFGGLSTWEGSGWFSGSRAGGLTLINDRDPKNAVQVTAGNLAGPGTFLELRAVDSEVFRWPLTFRLDQKQDAFRVDVGNLNDAAPIFIGAARGARGGLGTLRLVPGRLLVGDRLPDLKPSRGP